MDTERTPADPGPQDDRPGGHGQPGAHRAGATAAVARRPWYARPLTWIITVLAVIAVVVAAIIGVRIYADSQNSNAPAAFSSQSATDQGQAGDISGSWKTADGSQAGYRVGEVLNGEDVTVVGRTEDVEGDITIDGTSLKQGSTITVDLSTVTTDEDRRDKYFTSKAVDTSQYPDATFTVDSDTDRAALASDGSAEVEVPGTLEINGKKQDATVTMKASRSDDGLTVTGSTAVTWEDYGVKAPDMGFVSVEDSGSIEFSLNLEQA